MSCLIKKRSSFCPTEGSMRTQDEKDQRRSDYVWEQNESISLNAGFKIRCVPPLTTSASDVWKWEPLNSMNFKIPIFLKELFCMFYYFYVAVYLPARPKSLSRYLYSQRWYAALCLQDSVPVTRWLEVMKLQGKLKTVKLKAVNS